MVSKVQRAVRTRTRSTWYLVDLCYSLTIIRSPQSLGRVMVVGGAR